VEVLHAPDVATAAKPLERPAQVATDAYRRNWDRIFGEPASPTEDLAPKPSRLLN